MFGSGKYVRDPTAGIADIKDLPPPEIVKNAESVRKLALEAKAILGGYFREFTFAKRRSCGWTDCGCGAPFMPGVVLDPFMGTGTTLDVAKAMGRSAIGVDLDLAQVEEIL